MTTLLLLFTLSTPAQAPAAPEVDAKQLAAWLADLSARDMNKQTAARDALMKAGPKAKALVPDLIKIVQDEKNRGWAWYYSLDVLGAIGPDAKDAAPILEPHIKPQAYGGRVGQIAVAHAKIVGPQPATTHAMLLSSSKGQEILIAGSEYLKANAVGVAGHLLAFCGDKEAETRRRAVIILAGLPPSHYGNEVKPLAIEVGDAGKDAPATFLKMLADEDALVRMTAAHGLSRVAPDQAEKVIPVVIATMSDAKQKDRVGGVQSWQIFKPIPDAAARALIPLFDGADHGRGWAINTLSNLPVRAQLEATLKDGKTARTREAAAMTIGSRYADSVQSVPVLKAALDDRDFPVRFAAAIALVNVNSRAPGTGTVGVPVLAEGLKQQDDAHRLAAAQTLYRVGPPARAAVPELKRVLADKKPEVALGAALALVEIAQAEAADAVPVLTEGVKSESEPTVIRAARALGVLGPVAKAAVPELVKRFEAKTPQLRTVVAEAAARIDPAQAEKATEVLLKIFKDGNGNRWSNEALFALSNIGPAAKAAIPALLEKLRESQKKGATYFRVEIAFAVLAIDPETTEPVMAWIRDHIANGDEDDRYHLAMQLRRIGAHGKVLVGELVRMLDSKEAHVREAAAMTLAGIGRDAKDALPRLKELAAKDTSPNVRTVAATAIESIEKK